MSLEHFLAWAIILPALVARLAPRLENASLKTRGAFFDL
jgi:hypothetical protein